MNFSHGAFLSDRNPLVQESFRSPPGSVKITKPADVIVQFANAHNVDMIVLGTHGRTGLLHLLMGSVAESVMRQADCPVITIRQAKES